MTRRAKLKDGDVYKRQVFTPGVTLQRGDKIIIQVCEGTEMTPYALGMHAVLTPVSYTHLPFPTTHTQKGRGQQELTPDLNTIKQGNNMSLLQNIKRGVQQRPQRCLLYTSFHIILLSRIKSPKKGRFLAIKDSSFTK